MSGTVTGGEPAGAVSPAAPDRAAGEVVIRTRGLRKRYGDLLAVDGLDLEVRAGEVFGLLGPNGAGKTTTILMLLGLTEPDGGEARVLGLDPARAPLQVKRQVGYLPDDVGFYGRMTGRNNLRYTARLNGLTGADSERRLDALLAEVGLTGAADRPVDTYSRGMRQRLGIADALVKDPAVVVLDEPTIAIDPQGVADILAIVRSLARERGAAVLLSSHLLHQVESVCDRVGIFVGGRMVAEGRMDELAARLSSGRARVEVGVTDVAAAVAALRQAAGVEAVGELPGRPGLVVVDARSEAVGELAWVLAGARVGVTHLRRTDTALDELYHRYFAAHEHGGRAGGDGQPGSPAGGDGQPGEVAADAR